MKQKLNIKIEEVKMDKALQLTGMYGGACGGACGGGGNDVAGNLNANGFSNDTVGGYTNPNGVACGGCHGTTSDSGRQTNQAIGVAAAAAAGGVTGGLSGAIGAASAVSRR